MAGKYFHSDETSSVLYWSALKKGNESALETLYKLYADSLYSYGSKFTIDKDLIKECMQELFINIWGKRAGLSDPQNIKNYLFKSFRHLIFKKLSSRQKYIGYEEIEDYVFEASISIEEVIIQEESIEDIKNLLQTTLSRLTPRQKEAVFLKFYENLSYEEISVIMDISIKATYKIMNRSLVFLRENVSKSDFLIILSVIEVKLFI